MSKMKVFTLLFVGIGMFSCVNPDPVDKEKDHSQVEAADSLAVMLSIKGTQGQEYLFEEGHSSFRTRAIYSAGSDTATYQEEALMISGLDSCKIMFSSAILRKNYAPIADSGYYHYFNDSERINLITTTDKAFPLKTDHYFNGVCIKLSVESNGKSLKYTTSKANQKKQSAQKNASMNFTEVSNPFPGKIFVSGNFNATLYNSHADGTVADSIVINNAVFEAYF